MHFNEKSVSKNQQQFFGMVHKCQKTGECPSGEVEKVAKSIGYDDAEDFASTKHKGLPEKKKKKDESFKQWFDRQTDYFFKENKMSCTCQCEACKANDCKNCSCENCSCDGCCCN